MISLEHLISSGEWASIVFKDDWEENFYSFQIRLKNFYKLDPESIDEPEDVDSVDLESNIWILEADLVSLNKKKFDIDDLSSKIILVDEDGFEFNIVYDYHMCNGSEFAKKSGLSNFDSQSISPKIKRSGAFAFELPDFFDGLNLSVENGQVTNI